MDPRNAPHHARRAVRKASDAECDQRQRATVVGRLLTTLGLDRFAVANFSKSSVLEKAPQKSTHIFETPEFP